MKQFNALYYPEIVCLDEGVLKSLIVMYDNIYFLPTDIHLNPNHNSITSRFSSNDSILSAAFGTAEETYYFLMYSSEKNIWDRKLKSLMETYDFLEEKKVCIPLCDESFESSNEGHPLKGAVDSDMKDERFIYWCDKYRNKKLTIPNLPENAKIKGGGFATRPPLYKKEKGFAAICSERINAALYFAGTHDLIPVSTNELFLKLMGTKLQRAFHNPLFLEENQLSQQNIKTSLSILSWEVFTEVVSRDVLMQKNVTQLLKYRNESAELKLKFRDYLYRLQLMINKEPWDNSFKKEIDKIVKLEVMPEVENLREKKKVIWEKLFNEILKTSFSKRILIPLLSIHLIPNLSYLDLLCYSSATLISGVLPRLIDLRQEEKEINRNALFFLLRFK